MLDVKFCGKNSSLSNKYFNFAILGIDRTVKRIFMHDAITDMNVKHSAQNQTRTI
jgi:hypothetical protein